MCLATDLCAVACAAPALRAVYPRSYPPPPNWHETLRLLVLGGCILAVVLYFIVIHSA